MCSMIGLSYTNAQVSNDVGERAKGASSSQQEELSYKTKFDFVPGDKIVAFENFSQDAIGDFPARWNTNSSGELVSIDGMEGKWLMLNKGGVFMPEFIKELPENFTLEFDLGSNKELNEFTTGFLIVMAHLAESKEYTKWKDIAPVPGKTGVELNFHPNDGHKSALGRIAYTAWVNSKRVSENKASTNLFCSRSGKTFVHVSIWKQKQRLRVYMDAEKVWDLPKAFEATARCNAIIVALHPRVHKDVDRYFFGNMRLAVGAPDIRNKLMHEGKFTTAGILFDVNSDKIKPESYGLIKEIANVLKENAGIKIKVIGHTDADGDEAQNLELSKKRAVSVKNILTNDFGIDASRVETDGKGETQLLVKTDTPENKAQNRRVEFIKM